MNIDFNTELVVSQLVAMFIPCYISEVAIYLALVNVVPLKIEKWKAYLIGCLCAQVISFTTSVQFVFLCQKLVYISESIELLSKVIILVGEILVIVFLIVVSETPWYRIYWISYIYRLLFQTYLPYIYLSNFYDEKMYYLQPVRRNNLLLYLMIIVGMIILAYISGWLANKAIRKINVNKIQHWVWWLVYGLFLCIVCIVPKYSPDIPAEVIQSRSNFFQLFDLFSFVFTVTLIQVIIIVLAYNYSLNQRVVRDNILLQQQLEIQYKNYITIQTYEQETRKLYHDIGNHIKTVQILFQQVDKEEAQNYLNQLLADYSVIRKSVYCENVILNAILIQKVQLCENANIAFEADVNLPNNLSVKDIDLMRLVSNLLDNAIEACEKSESENKYISLKAEIIANAIFIKVKNSKSSKIIIKQGEKFITSKLNRNLHGKGLLIIHDVIEKYQGMERYEDTVTEFEAIVSIPLPEKGGY